MKLFFKKNRKFLSIILVVFVFAIFFILTPQVTYASVGTAVATVIGWILWPFIMLIGKLATIFLNILIGVAQYNDFIHSSAVTYGWKIVRDLCNMFFVLILLIISFATILQVESYNLKKLLPKLVIMAVLINFSKLICGVFIDFTQVIMLTFINAVKDIAGGNLATMLGMTDILSFNSNSSDDVTGWTIIGSMLLALVLVIVAAVVILTMLIMLIMRIIMIWIYVVLSPLAYLLASFPQGQQYSQKWWTDFSKNLIVGPIIAFFLWLSFASLGGVGSSEDINAMKPKNKFAEEMGGDAAGGGGSSAAAITEAGSMDNLIKILISVGMLLGGLQIAQEMGGMAGKVAGKGMAKLQTMGAGAMKAGKRAVGIERAENAYKAYQQKKESARMDVAQKDSGKLLKAEEFAKKNIAKLPNKLVRQPIDRGVKNLMGVKKAKESLSEQKKQLAKLEVEIKGADNLKISGEKKINEAKEKNNLATNLRDSHDKYAQFENELRGMSNNDPRRNDVEQKLQSEAINLKNLKTEAGLDPGAGSSEVEKKVNELTQEGQLLKQEGESEKTTAEENITRKEGKAQELKGNIVIGEKNLYKKERKAELVSNGLAGVVGGTFGAVMGGGFPGAVIGAVAGITGRNKLMHAGETAGDLASNYNFEQINKHKEKIKDKDPQELRKVSEDYSLSSHERSAADMILMEKGELSHEEAEGKRDRIKNNFGKDNKVMDQMDGSLSNHYQDLSQVFHTLNNSTGQEQEKAQDKIVKGIVSGSIKLENINDKGSFDLIIKKLADVWGGANLANAHKSQVPAKQKMIEESLNNNKSDKKCGKVLVDIKKDLGVLDNPEAKKEYLEGASITQLQNLTDTAKGTQSIVKHLEESGKLNTIRMFAMQDKMKDVAGEISKVTTKTPLNYNTAGHKGIINAIVDAVKS